MSASHRKLNVTHTFSANPGKGNLNPTAITYYPHVFNAFIFAACALIIPDRAIYALAK
jgi:hypothetical protein